MGRQSRRRHAALHRDSRTPESHGHSGHEHDSSHTPRSCRGLTGVEGAGSIPRAVGVALVDCVRPGALAAEDYPTKPIRRWTPFSPGGGTDILVRLIGPQVSEALGATIIVDNRPDRGRHPGAGMPVRADPDSYTLIMVSGSYGANPVVHNLPYELHG